MVAKFEYTKVKIDGLKIRYVVNFVTKGVVMPVLLLVWHWRSPQAADTQTVCTVKRLYSRTANNRESY